MDLLLGLRVNVVGGGGGGGRVGFRAGFLVAVEGFEAEVDKRCGAAELDCGFEDGHYYGLGGRLELRVRSREMFERGWGAWKRLGLNLVESCGCDGTQSLNGSDEARSETA